MFTSDLEIDENGEVQFVGDPEETARIIREFAYRHAFDVPMGFWADGVALRQARELREALELDIWESGTPVEKDDMMEALERIKETFGCNDKRNLRKILAGLYKEKEVLK